MVDEEKLHHALPGFHRLLRTRPDHHPGATRVEQAIWFLGIFSMSTRQIRQLPAMDRWVIAKVGNGDPDRLRGLMRFHSFGNGHETPSMVRVTCRYGLSGISISGNRRGGQATTIIRGDVVLELVPERNHSSSRHGDGVPRDMMVFPWIRSSVDEEVQVDIFAPSRLERSRDLKYQPVPSRHERSDSRDTPSVPGGRRRHAREELRDGFRDEFEYHVTSKEVPDRRGGFLRWRCREPDRAGHLTIDGVSVTVPKGMNLIEAAKTVGIRRSHFCLSTSIVLTRNENRPRGPSPRVSMVESARRMSTAAPSDDAQL